MKHRSCCRIFSTVLRRDNKPRICWIVLLSLLAKLQVRLNARVNDE